MNISEKFQRGLADINKILWIIFIPIALDLLTLFFYQHIFETVYTPARKLFMIKIGFISSPPSAGFLLEDFPSAIFKYSNNSFNGIINRFSPFSVLMCITFILVISFVNSGFLAVIGEAGFKPAGIKEFFILGNKLWFRFFIMNIINSLPFVLMLIKKELVFLGFINLIFVYVEYSFIVDKGSIRHNFSKGISFLFGNLGLTIKMALYLGLIFSLLSIVIFLLAALGTIGVVIDIIIIAYFGSAANKTILEVYREKGQPVVS